MGIQVIHHQHHFFGLRRVDLDQLPYKGSPVVLRAALGHLNLSPPREWLASQKQVANPFAMVFVILFGVVSWLAGQGITHLAEQSFTENEPESPCDLSRG
ncbi:hypothetical protein KSC_110270 [Ktedonobacter sp. SOSP1-52]|nr:hypothetical protein KSC_110270 [Ktedonobacter sp. SOSP1-52]